MKAETNSHKAIKATYVSIFGNAVLAAVKFLAGVFGHSFALVADAIESTTDIFSSLLVLIGLKVSVKPPDKNHPYGHGRAETIVTFLVVEFLAISAVIIADESIKNIRTPHEMPHAFTLWVLGAVIIWKEISFQWVSRKARETNSSSLKADAWHHRSDAITSVAAFIGISVALILGPGHEAADDWAALVASLIILYNSYLILRPALGELMDEHVYDDLVKKIREVAGKVPGIIRTEKCYIRKAGMKYFVDLHASVNGSMTVTESHALGHKLKDAVINEIPEIENVLVHMEPDNYS